MRHEKKGGNIRNLTEPCPVCGAQADKPCQEEASGLFWCAGAYCQRVYVTTKEAYECVAHREDGETGL